MKSVYQFIKLTLVVWVVAGAAIHLLAQAPQARGKQDGCWEVRKVWVPGRYADQPDGKRKFIPGQWGEERVRIACPDEPIAGDCRFPTMGPIQFEKALHTVAGRNFEASKLSTATELVHQNCLSSRQIAEMAELFEFEESRIELAKAAYAHTTDPQNYGVVVRTLMQHDSQLRLMQYLRERGAAQFQQPEVAPASSYPGN